MLKTRRAVAGVIVATGLMLPATAEAQTCTWQRTDFTVPEPHYNVEVFGIGGDYAVGTAITDGTRIVRWHNGQGTVLEPPAEGDFVWPVAVSANGTVVAKQSARGYVTKLDGTHQFLGTGDGETAEPMSINGHGDVAGYVHGSGQSKNVVWSGSDYSKYEVYSMTNVGVAGIDDTNALVTTNGVKYRSPKVGWPLQKAHGYKDVVVEEFDHGIAVGWTHKNGSRMALVWNDNSSLRVTIPSAVAYSANTRGTIIGSAGDGSPRLWRAGGMGVLPSPAPLYYATFVTEDDRLIGTYKDSNDDGHAAAWSCS